jgi:hypothetical protein
MFIARLDALEQSEHLVAHLELDELGEHQRHGHEPDHAGGDRDIDDDSDRGVGLRDRLGAVLSVGADVDQLAADFRQSRLGKALPDPLLELAELVDDLHPIEGPV